MIAFLAIVQDTWRLSCRQAVFVILLVLMALGLGAFLVLPRITVDENGERVLGIRFSDKKDAGFDEQWSYAYENLSEYEKRPQSKYDPESKEWQEFRERRRAGRERRDQESSGRSPFQRSVEFWLFTSQQFLFTLAMWFFVAAAAGYFPGFMQVGAIDVVLAKPVSRTLAYFSRFAGGMVFLLGALAFCQIAMFLWGGLAAGLWHPRIFLSLPLMAFVAALLFAIVALLGILTRSSTMALLVGYFFYLIVDTALATFYGLYAIGKLDDYPFLVSALKVLRQTIPNFSNLKGLASASVLTLPDFDWQPFIVGGIWFTACLGTGYWIFRRRDF